MSIQPVLLIRAWCIMGKNFFPVIKLRNILCCPSQCIVNRLVRTDRKNNIRSSSRQYCIQKCCRIHNLHIDLHAAFRSKGIIHHGFQDCSLITSGEDPYLNDLIIPTFIVYITHRIIINKEGCKEGLCLMPELRKYICLILLGCNPRAGNHQIINIELCFAHI